MGRAVKRRTERLIPEAQERFPTFFNGFGGYQLHKLVAGEKADED